MKTEELQNNENLESIVTENSTQYVDQFGNPIDPSLIDANGNYIGETQTQYVDQFGNPIDPSLIDANGNYIGPTVDANDVAQSLSDAETVTHVETAPISASEHQMDDKAMFDGMVTFDYNNVPITDIVNSIILDAINKGASDIHFDPFDDGLKIRIRIDGQLNDYSIVPLFVKKNMITRIKIISGMNITESRTPQDGAIRTELANKTIDLRVSCLPTNMGEKIVIRIMDYSMSASGIEALDFNEENLEKVKKMMALPNGIILVTGATGTGKSTTVYSMLQRLNVEGTNLITVEDPIEMNIGGINQVQANPEIGLTFANVLRSILRQDPDVIMIGEIRDDETARIAVRASITGHLVLSTIHTNNSLNTIERLTDMSVERYLLGTALSGIISQKLARRLCEKCKRLRPTNEYEKEIFKKALNKDINEIYEPVGCPECSRGYRGRIAIQEVLLLNQVIKDAVTKGIPKNVLRELVYGENGTETMLQDGLEKVLEGKTSFDEILKLIDLEDDLGTGTQLGMDEQLSASMMTNGYTNQQVVNPNIVGTPINLGNNPININITPELIESLTNLKINTNKENNIEESTINDNIETLETPEDEVIETLDAEPSDNIETLDEISNEELETLDVVEEDNLADYNRELETDNVETLEEVTDISEPTLEEPIIEEIKEDNKLDKLYDKLLRTKNTLTKKKYKLHVKEVLEEIKDNIGSNNLPDKVLEYFNYIAINDILSKDLKDELIKDINNKFNINLQVIENEDTEDNKVDDLTYEDILNLVPNQDNYLSSESIDEILGLSNNNEEESEESNDEQEEIDNSSDLDDSTIEDEPNEDEDSLNKENIDITLEELDNILSNIDTTDIDSIDNIEEPIDDEPSTDDILDIDLDDITTEEEQKDYEESLNKENIDISLEELDNILSDIDTNDIESIEDIKEPIEEESNTEDDDDIYDTVDDEIINALLDNIEYDEDEVE